MARRLRHRKLKKVAGNAASARYRRCANFDSPAVVVSAHPPSSAARRDSMLAGVQAIAAGLPKAAMAKLTDAARAAVDCPDCSGTKTATGWTLRRTAQHPA